MAIEQAEFGGGLQSVSTSTTGKEVKTLFRVDKERELITLQLDDNDNKAITHIPFADVPHIAALAVNLTEVAAALPALIA